MARFRETLAPLFGPGRRRARPRRWPGVWECGGLLFVVLLAGLAVAGLRDGEPAFPLLGGHAGFAERPESLAIITHWAGPARVTGGDTLKVAGERIRLFGLEAPASGQTCTRAKGRSWPCGAQASALLKRLVAEAGGRVSCGIEMRDADGWAVSTCEAGGADLGAAMVEAGLALTHRLYPTRYAAEEAEAKRLQAGLWAGAFERPLDWRVAGD